MAQRRFLQVPRTKVRRVATQILDHIPNTRRDPPLTRGLRIRRLNTHENAERSAAEAAAVSTSLSLPMGWRWPIQLQLHRLVGGRARQAGSWTRPGGTSYQDVYSVLGRRDPGYD